MFSWLLERMMKPMIQSLSEQLTERFRKLQIIYKGNYPFFRILGPGRSTLIILGGFFFCLASSLNYLALFPVLALLIGEENKLIDKYLKPVFSSVDWSLVDLNTWIAASIIVVFLAKFFLGIAFSYMAGDFGEAYVNRVRENILKLFEIDKFNRSSKKESEYYHLFNLCPRLASFNWAFLSFNVRILMFVISFLIIVTFSWQGATALVIFAFIWMLLLVPLFRSTRRAADSYLSGLRVLMRFLAEHLNGMEIFQIFGRVESRNQEFAVIRKNLERQNAWLSIARQATSNLQEILVVFILAALLIFKTKYAFDISLIITFGYVASKVLAHLNECSSFFSAALEQLPAAAELSEAGVIGNKDLEIKGAFPRVKDFTSSTTVTLKAVNVIYDAPGTSLFAPVNLTLKSGDSLAISGPNGVGKSTLIKCLLGLLPYSGSFKVNDQEIYELKWPAISKVFSYVGQNQFLVAGTVLENIIFGSTVTDNEVIQLIQSLQIDIKKVFAQGLSHEVKENGENLSGGQKQIISILRALVKPYEVLVLDEYANHLSIEMKDKVEAYLRTLKTKILVVISHQKIDFVSQTMELRAP
jgi:ABC-type transport system involved in cytochrome bd biosynthesis fused ATPase/permease subunit